MISLVIYQQHGAFHKEEAYLVETEPPPQIPLRLLARMCRSKPRAVLGKGYFYRCPQCQQHMQYGPLPPSKKFEMCN